jgi:F-type H+-transporting ATPase subunit b
MSALSAALLAAGSEGGGGLADINLGLTIWTIVLFALFAFVLGKFGWSPLLKMIEERETGIRSAVDGAQKANTEAQALLAQHKELMREAGREREEIVKRALKDAEQLKADLAARAKAESDQMVQRARDQIEREKGQAILELRAQVADLAIQAASKIVTTSLTPEAQRKLVDDFIKTMPREQ